MVDISLAGYIFINLQLVKILCLLVKIRCLLVKYLATKVKGNKIEKYLEQKNNTCQQISNFS